MIICGVGACQALDSSGEVLDIKGLDISSLEIDGCANFEHEEKLTSQIVGKVFKAKKIFSEADCETSQELKSWKKLQVPFLWVVIELFDDVGHDGAKDIASMIRYDEKKRAEDGYKDGMRPVVNFSVQGGKLEKQGNVITHSLARKISVTIVPANKICEAEQYKPDNIDTENKSSSKISDMRAIRSQMFKYEEIQVEELRKDEPSKKSLFPKFGPIPTEPISPDAVKLGTTSTGKPVLAAGHHSNYSSGFTPNEHKEAANLHSSAAQNTTFPKTKRHHFQQAQWHTSMMNKKPKWSSQRATAMQPKPAQSAVPMPQGNKPNAPASKPAMSPVSASTSQPYGGIPGKGRGIAKSLKKAIDAGSTNVAPGNLTGGAALQKQTIEKGMKKTVNLAKAEQEISVALPTWQKAESFRKFLDQTKPDMTPEERTALTRLFALYRAKKPGNSLA